MTLLVSEVFGPTLQGEGPSQGQRAMFVRLGRCNLDCSWCDTPYTWDWTGKNGTTYDPKVEITETSTESLVGAVAGRAPLVVVTGGEPLVQRQGLVEFIDRLMVADPSVAVEVETNGTHPPLKEMIGVRYNVSPKLANSGVPESRRIREHAILSLVDSHRARWKFVVADHRDLDEVDALVARFGLGDVWLMPEGRNAPTLLARLGWLADAAIARGYNVTPRVHVLAWGDRRGV